MRGAMLCVNRVRARLGELRLFIHPNKIQHMVEVAQVLGHLVSHNSIRPLPTYITDVLATTLPVLPRAVRQFCGAVAWLSKFIPRCQLLLRGFRSDPCERTFRLVVDAVQQCVSIAPLWEHVGELSLHVDASGEGYGGVLSQSVVPVEGGDAVTHVLGFTSGAWLDAQTRWMVREQEMYAVLCALRSWRVYVFGRAVHVYTDHRANTSVTVHKKLNVSKVTGWLEELGQYNIVWHFVPGVENGLADFLSRVDVLARHRGE
jgi:hypothetical protein